MFKFYLCIHLIINHFVKGECGYEFTGLSVGHHTITFEFIPTKKLPQPLSPKQYNFDVYPTGKYVCDCTNFKCNIIFII